MARTWKRRDKEKGRRDTIEIARERERERDCASEREREGVGEEIRQRKEKK